MKLAIIASILFFAGTAAAQDPTPESEPAPAPAPPPPPPERTVNTGAPIGQAAPPTEAGTRLMTGPVRAGLEVFSQYSYRNYSNTWFHEFDVPRVHGAVEGEYDGVRGRVVMEAARSAGDGALIGVSGDSLVLRVREAYAAYRPVAPLEISAGVIPEMTVPELDGTWMMRAIAPSGLENSGLMNAADLGAKARVDLPGNYGWLGTALYNGDGYTNRELNRGKNFEGAANIHPLPSIANERLRPLGVFASYQAGSTGTSLARANRLTGGLLWQGERIRGGLYATQAWGVAQLGTQKALLLSAFVRVEPIPRLLLGARIDHENRNTDATPEDRVTTLWLAAGWRVAMPLEVFLAFDRTIPTTRAEQEVPGSDAFQLRVIARVVF